VILVGDQDNNYSSGEMRATMLAHGKISFRTCLRQVRFPASYFAILSGLNYGTLHPELTSLDKAIEHWILVELLNAIGGHSIL
jgi:hypothetical protein